MTFGYIDNFGEDVGVRVRPSFSTCFRGPCRTSAIEMEDPRDARRCAVALAISLAALVIAMTLPSSEVMSVKFTGTRNKGDDACIKDCNLLGSLEPSDILREGRGKYRASSVTARTN